jgi:hypothetical protein
MKKYLYDYTVQFIKFNRDIFRDEWQSLVGWVAKFREVVG